MGDNHFSIVNGAVVKEINRKKEILEKDPCYHLAVSAKRKKVLQRESARHSVSIEIVGDYGSSSKGKRDKSREIRRCEKNLFNALDWGVKNYQKCTTIDYLQELGKLIEPEENKMGFRDEEVRISGSHISPLSPRKINSELEAFLMNNNCFSNPVEKSLHVHFHVARIHPFFDGNGRTSRLMQNIILEKGGFLPITLKIKDRGEYMHLIDKAIESRWVVTGKLSQVQSSHYRECRKKLLENKDLTKKERNYCCSVLAEFSKSLLTSEVYEFYNFLALKERDALQVEQDCIYDVREKKKSCQI